MPIRKPVFIDVVRPTNGYKTPIGNNYECIPHLKSKATCYAQAVSRFWSPKDGTPFYDYFLHVRGSKRFTNFRTWYLKNYAHPELNHPEPWDIGL